MTTSVDITAVLTTHAEGLFIGPSLGSFELAIDAARGAGLLVEGMVMMDRPTAETRLQLAGIAGHYRVIETNLGDPGQARNAAVEAADGAYVAFLDGDDMWSPNWLALSHAFCKADPQFVVAHSEINVIFGQAHNMWWHADSRMPSFDAEHLRVGNYWDAMAFAARTVFRRFPFRPNDLKRGFGHEDWHWNCVTLAAGIDHRPVPDTVHFKRRRKGSQLALCDAVSAIPWVTPLTSYAWSPLRPLDQGTPVS